MILARSVTRFKLHNVVLFLWASLSSGVKLAMASVSVVFFCLFSFLILVSLRQRDSSIFCSCSRLFSHVSLNAVLPSQYWSSSPHFPPTFWTENVMIDKLQKLEVPAALVNWVFNFLSNRPQCVRVGDIKSPVRKNMFAK